MKTVVLGLALVGLAIGWGSYGQKQIRTGRYDCEFRVESLCFSWKMNDEGKKRDGVSERLNRE